MTPGDGLPPYSLRLTPTLFEWVRPWRSVVDIRCGGHRPPPNRPFAQSLYPFTTLTKLDFEGYPNWRDKRLEVSLSLGPSGWYVGYEDGEFVAAGTFLPGRTLRWELTLEVTCATHADTFVEFVVEPNPRVGLYDGPDRMRCLSGALGKTWTGRRGARAWFEVEAASARDFTTRGAFVVDAADASQPAELELQFESARSTTRHDARRDDALWQLRWRIDRIANLDAYDDTYQVNDGTNGGAIERELRVVEASFRGS